MDYKKEIANLLGALNVCYKSLSTYGEHPIIKNIVEKANERNSKINFTFNIEEMHCSTCKTITGHKLLADGGKWTCCICHPL